MTSTEFERERLELERVLNSGIFNRAPNLALLLNYVCSRYFEHGADQIKEYNIAVEALGRPPEFDPRGDSIVRVEAHRLRKRLREYYLGDGASHSIHIEIPSGQYAPRFLFHSNGVPSNGAPSNGVPANGAPEHVPAPVVIAAPVENFPASPLPPPAIVQITPRRAANPIRAWIALGALLLVGGAYAVVRFSHTPFHGGVPGEPIVVTGGDTIRIACGLEDGKYTDQFGNTWSHDEYFQGGWPVHETAHPIWGTRDQRLYNTRREGAFRYDIPLKPGSYELRLHFAETVYGLNNAAGGGESSRVFGISINGKEVLPRFDVIADREASTADIRVFKDLSPAADGRLHLAFSPVSNMPILSGIEITPGTPGRMRPIRMVAQDHGYTDKQGRFWEPDRYALGGQLVTRNDVVAGGSDPDLYHGERYGNLTYVVPVAEGRYRLTLHFAETWFGPGKSGGEPGIGKRVFDILCNGIAIKRDFDIFKEAGGSDRAVTVEIPSVTPNHQGKIVISLSPAENYACINAIEIVDES